ncbi:MAG TPA: methyltransferase domain-containing protein [Acetobacteraceae bacterium]|jgi:ubiquinone/menaquinone biosynthesis C-methylase UbiE|nr:methyltransferase domain-containing protein [Acetobacteraceae bacterium]
MSDRTTTADQWKAASDGWARWAARTSDYLIPMTEKMLNLAAVAPGCRVLDIGCGSGEQTVIAARRVGETGHVFAIDIAAPMVAATEKNVAAAGLRNVTTRVCPADALPDEAESFDAAISRLVLMLVPDPVAVASAVLAVLRPGGAFAAIVPGDPAKTGFAAVTLDILARHGGKTNWEDKPGSIRSLADLGRLESVFRDAGFIDVQTMSVPAVLRLESASMMTTVIRDGYAAFTALIADIPQSKQDAAWKDVGQALKRFEGKDGFAGPNDMNLVVGRKPLG